MGRDGRCEGDGGRLDLGPVETIAEFDGRAGDGQPVGDPEGGHVGGETAAGGCLDELDSAWAPVAQWLDPGGGATVVVGVEVAVVFEDAVALEQAEAAKGVDGDAGAEGTGGILERAPEAGAVGRAECETVGLMDLGAGLASGAVGVLAVPEHTGQRGEPRLGDGGAEGERGADVDGCRLAGGDDELVRA
jgi:hypothetical protein